MCPSQIPEGATRGWIVPIGGGEEKEHKPQILQRFVELCGGALADIVVLPTASRLADTGARYERIFSGLGAGRVTSVDFDSRAECENEASLARIAEATGLFFAGGGTPVAKLIRSRNAEGMHVAGTSTGASFISEHMIAFGEDGASPVAGAPTASSWPASRSSAAIIPDRRAPARCCAIPVCRRPSWKPPVAASCAAAWPGTRAPEARGFDDPAVQPAPLPMAGCSCTATA